MHDKVNIMLDFEMLGPGDDAKVIGVGAAVFGAHPAPVAGRSRREPFARPVYEAWPISVKGQDARTHTWDTIAWWHRQDPEVSSAAFEAMDGGRSSRKGRVLRLAVKELVDAAVDLGSHGGPGDLTLGEAWERVTWWAMPAAADLSLWMSLLREFRPDLARLYGRVRDGKTLLDACEAATGVRPASRREVGPQHSPAADALSQAWQCAEAMALLADLRERTENG